MARCPPPRFWSPPILHIIQRLSEQGQKPASHIAGAGVSVSWPNAVVRARWIWLRLMHAIPLAYVVPRGC